jgi:hypothetical protein
MQAMEELARNDYVQAPQWVEERTSRGRRPHTLGEPSDFSQMAKRLTQFLALGLDCCLARETQRVPKCVATSSFFFSLFGNDGRHGWQEELCAIV